MLLTLLSPPSIPPTTGMVLVCMAVCLALWALHRYVPAAAEEEEEEEEVAGKEESDGERAAFLLHASGYSKMP
jgi:hypothetical protein